MAGTAGRTEPRLVLLAFLERGARVLRRVGLGRLVDAAARRVAPVVGSFSVEVDGLTLEGDHIGQLYYARELVGEGREGYFVEQLTSAARPGATVVDGGAHIGYVTLQAARAVGPSGNVVSFEPNPRTVPVLRRNVDRNGVADRVRIVEAALGDAVRRASFHVTDSGDTSSLHASELAGADVVVDVTTGDEALPAPARIDVLKLDAEGGEVAALRGMRSLIERSAPGPVIFVECNPGLLRAAGTSDAELLALLAELGFVTRWIDEDERRLRPVEEIRWTGEYVNLRADRRDASAE